MIAGLTAFGAIVYGGINYILSAGNVTNQQDAKDQITQAIVGLLLLLGAYLILYTINPSLVSLTNPEREIINIEKIIEEGQKATYISNSPESQTPGSTTEAPYIEGCRLAVNPGLTLNTSQGQTTSKFICIGGCIDNYTKDFEGGCLSCEKALQRGYFENAKKGLPDKKYQEDCVGTIKS